MLDRVWEQDGLPTIALPPSLRGRPSPDFETCIWPTAVLWGEHPGVGGSVLSVRGCATSVTKMHSHNMLAKVLVSRYAMPLALVLGALLPGCGGGGGQKSNDGGTSAVDGRSSSPVT